MPNEKAISVDYVAGQLDAIKDLIASHADNSSRRFDKVDTRLDEQDQQHAADKAEAKRENVGRHEQNQKLWTETHAMAKRASDWIDTAGGEMHRDWVEGKRKREERKLLNKGRMMAWGKIAGLGTLILTILGYIGWDSLVSLLDKITDRVH